MFITADKWTVIVNLIKGNSGVDHEKITNQLIGLMNCGFTTFIFDFIDMDVQFNSIISGFVLLLVRKLIEHDKHVVLRNISEIDREFLELIGINLIRKENLVMEMRQ